MLEGPIELEFVSVTELEWGDEAAREKGPHSTHFAVCAWALTSKFPWTKHLTRR